jgi:multiple sugar transport system substrate-binding protein
MNQRPRVRLQQKSLKLVFVSLFGFLVSLISVGSAQVQIDYWDMVWGPPEYIDTAKALVERFNQEHPDIQVTYTSVPWANWYQTYVTAVGSGTAPCASTGAGYQAAQLSDFGAIRPMDDLIEELRTSGDADDFVEGTIDTLQYNGSYVALPWGFDIRVWYYRKDLLDAAGIAVPTNWEELKAAAIALTQDDTYGLVVPSDTLGTHNLYTLILNNGGALFTPDGQLDFTSERNLEALQFFADLVNEGAVHPASAGYDADQARNVFLQGNAAFFLDGPGLMDRAGDQAANIAVLPPIEGLHGDTGTIRWVNNIMMYNQCEHVEEAKTFLKWWSQNQLPLWTEGNNGNLPVRISFTQDPYITENETRSYVFENYIPIGKTTGYAATGIFPALNELEGEGVMHTLVQDLLQGNDFQASIDKAKARLETIVQ